MSQTPSTVHPFDGTLYSLTSDGHITVTGEGKSGTFTDQGIWISGEIRECDPQLCVWVSNQPDMAALEAQSHLGTASGESD